MGLLLLLTAGLSTTLAQESEEPRQVLNGIFRRAKERGAQWEANAFLAGVVSGRRTGKALDIGMGQGRNALLLSALGWEVTGFDISDKAVRQAREAAERARLELDARVADVNTFEYGDPKPIVRFVARKPLATTGLRGSYLGQDPPGTTPNRFAPGLVCTEAIELNGVLAPDGRELFFTRQIAGTLTLHRSALENGEWSVPRPLYLYPGRERAMAVDMAYSVDGRELYFLGRCRSELSPRDLGLDLWVSTRTAGGWSTARVLPPPVSTEASESYPCAVADGSLYFSSDRAGGHGDADVYRAQRRDDGSFDAPVNLGPAINSDARESDTYVVPDESYLIVTSSRPGGRGEADLYVSFREADGAWGTPVSLGDTVNSEHTDFCPMVTPDGKYLFFSRRRSDPPGSGWTGAVSCDVYWVDVAVLEPLRD